MVPENKQSFSRHVPRRSPEERRLVQGLAAWDELYSQSDEELLNTVNHLMLSDEKLPMHRPVHKLAFSSSAGVKSASAPEAVR